jgi:zinc transporter ZupT
MVILIQLFGLLSFAVGVAFAWIYWPGSYSVSEFDPLLFSRSLVSVLGGLLGLAVLFGFADLIQSNREIRDQLTATKPGAQPRRGAP